MRGSLGRSRDCPQHGYQTQTLQLKQGGFDKTPQQNSRLTTSAAQTTCHSVRCTAQQRSNNGVQPLEGGVCGGGSCKETMAMSCSREVHSNVQFPGGNPASMRGMRPGSRIIQTRRPAATRARSDSYE